MTVSYNYDVSSASIMNFFKITMRWRGSIYKNVKTGLAIWLISYFIISAVYRFGLDDKNKHKFNHIATFIDNNINNIPLQLLLGFFVSIIIDRWKQTFYNMGYIETAALTVSANLWGAGEETRIQRRAIIRYLVLHQILVFRDVSIQVRRRFPNLDAISTAGFALQHEIDNLKGLKFDYQRYWVPINWAISLVMKANQQKKFDSDAMMNSIIQEICKFRSSIAQLSRFDWVPIPIKYIQVVAMSVHVYFFLCLISRQYLLLNDPESDVFDLYFPFTTVLQFIFLFGWLQVAVDVLNPMGDSDDDFECNFLIDKNIATGLAIVDRAHHQPPMEIDMFADKDGFRPMYTPESAALLGKGLSGSVANVNLHPGDDKAVPMVELIPRDSSKKADPISFRERLSSGLGRNRLIFKSHQIRPIDLGMSLPANINLNPDRPRTHFDDIHEEELEDTKV